MKRHKHFFTLFVLVITLVIAGTSCTDPGPEVGTLTLNMQMSSRSRALIPGETPLEVARYIVMGTGPQGATFNVSTSTKSVDIEGLLLGEWSIRAIGQNQGGTDLVEGTIDTIIGTSPNIVIIELNELIGKGTLNLTLDWSEIEIASPSTTLRLIDAEGNTRTLNPTVNNAANGSVTYQELLDAGSYTVTAQLENNGEPIAGFADFIRIVSNRTTEAQITFEIEDYTTLPASVTMVDHLGTPIECEIAGLPEEVPAFEPVTVYLSSDSDAVIDAVWYLDGAEIARGMECTFRTAIGSHRLDVLAQGALLASLDRRRSPLNRKSSAPRASRCSCATSLLPATESRSMRGASPNSCPTTSSSWGTTPSRRSMCAESSAAPLKCFTRTRGNERVSYEETDRHLLRSAQQSSESATRTDRGSASISTTPQPTSSPFGL